MPDAVLVLNAGSSSIKFSVYALDEGDRLALDSKGQVEGISTEPRFLAHDANGEKLRDEDFALFTRTSLATSRNVIEPSSECENAATNALRARFPIAARIPA